MPPKTRPTDEQALDEKGHGIRAAPPAVSAPVAPALGRRAQATTPESPWLAPRGARSRRTASPGAESEWLLSWRYGERAQSLRERVSIGAQLRLVERQEHDRQRCDRKRAEQPRAYAGDDACVFPECEREVVLRPISGTFEEEHVDEFSRLGARQKARQLCGAESSSDSTTTPSRALE